MSQKQDGLMCGPWDYGSGSNEEKGFVEMRSSPAEALTACRNTGDVKDGPRKEHPKRDLLKVTCIHDRGRTMNIA